MPKLTSKELTIQSKLLGWYKKNKRILPGRKLDKKKSPNTYHVLVSEFMLQQTTVNTVISRFEDFIKKWPNLKKLSMINENQILQFWSGLGYYARAKNLLNSAKIISLKFNNIVPDNYNDLIDLPGVGDYTAKAVLGIGYNKSVMPVDTNIKRILARLYGLEQSINLINKKITSLSKFYESKKQYIKLNKKEIFSEQTRMINKLNKIFSADIFSNFVPSYKNLASIYQIFNKNVSIKSKILLEK